MIWPYYWQSVRGSVAGTGGPGGGVHSIFLDALLAYWRQDQAAGAASVSSVGGYSLTAASDPGSGVGKSGAAGDYDGTSYHSNTVPESLAGVGLSGWSLSLWFNTRVDTGVRQAFCHREGGSGSSRLWQIIRHDTSVLNLYWGSGVTAEFDVIPIVNPVPRDAWHHVVVTAAITSSSIISVYYDGELVAAPTESLFVPATAGYTTKIGLGGDVLELFDGLVDEVGIWGRELTAGDVATLYNGGAGLFY